MYCVADLYEHIVRTLWSLFLGADDECCMMYLIKSQRATAARTSAFLSLSRREGHNETLH